MMIRVLDWVRAYTQLAWWDGSCVDLRLHRILERIESGLAAPEARLALAPVLPKWGDRP